MSFVFTRSKPRPQYIVDRIYCLCYMSKTIENYNRMQSVVFTVHPTVLQSYPDIFSCVSVAQCLEHCVGSAKGCGFDSQGTHVLTKKSIA